IRNRLQNWGVNENSPLAKIPQTYLSRLFVLDDVYTESLPGPSLTGAIGDLLSIKDSIRKTLMPREDHLKSRYLVFSSDFHAPGKDEGCWVRCLKSMGKPDIKLDSYLRGMWNAIEEDIRQIWGFCYGFDQVKDADGFVQYMNKCQLDVALFFVGSTDDSLEEQLKSLYIKQELAKFAVDHQGLPADQLQQAYREFIQRVEPTNLTGPTWVPGKSQ
ncbi:MAG: hypothetical protein PHE55_21420, partial [Methylococcaceae bacterium]|nr:hypothetical protein [Methylococcaceae bacterium]